MGFKKWGSGFGYILVIAILVGVCFLYRTAQAQTDNPSSITATVLGFDPAYVQLQIDEEINLDIIVTDVTNLYGIEFILSFDPAVVEVVDSNALQSGIQIVPGSCPSPDFTVTNAADNSLGTVEFAATSLSPSQPCSGNGVVASITFRGVTSGTSLIEIDSWLLADTGGFAISTDVSAAELVVATVTQDTLLSIEPASESVLIGQTTTLDVVLNDVVNLYGIEWDITFDPAIVEVVDADSNQAGIQIQPGECPVPDFVVLNDADNQTGVISFAATSLAPSSPCDGNGRVATITFRGISDGTSAVQFSSWLLADTNGLEIPSASQNGSLVVGTGETVYKLFIPVVLKR